MDNKTYMKKYREEHREEIKVYARKYRVEHEDEVKAYQIKYHKQYYAKHKFRRNKEAITWTKDNPERARELRRESAKRMRQKYPERMRARVNASTIKIPFNQDCEHCEMMLATEKHHNDYTKAKEVMFVCSPCNKMLG